MLHIAARPHTARADVRGLARGLIRTLALCLIVVAGVHAQTRPTVVAGPMAGYRDMHMVRLWLQTDRAARARIEYWPEDHAADVQRSDSQALTRASDFSAVIDLDGLQAGQRYQYRVLLDDQPFDGVHRFATQTRWQYRDGVEPPDFIALFGSCAYVNDAERDRSGKPYGGGYDIFTAMAAKLPDLTLWLGDNLYFREDEYTSPQGMAYRYRHDRALPELQTLLHTGHHMAIWDDHDYGSNDSNSSFVFKQASLDLFRRYWANGSYGLPGAPGVYSVFSFNDADFFLLDDRWYRDADSAKGLPDKTMFGAAQLRWLKNALLDSTAPFKIIVNGSQMLSDQNRFEGWLNFGDERKNFLDWLALNRVNGVLFLSGDRHHTELLRQNRPGAYPLYDFTCSPLTAGTHRMDGEADKPQLVAGTLVGQRNFCSLKFSGPAAQRMLTLESYDHHGVPLWSRRLARDELTYSRP